MTSTPVCAPSAPALLSAAISDPFENFDDFHIAAWFRQARTDFPLLTFQGRRYAALQEFDLPTVEPLPVFVESILADEGRFASRRELLDPIEAFLDQRRSTLSRDENWFEQVGDDGDPLIHQNYPIFIGRFDLAEYEMVDDDGGYGYVSPYEDVGRELTELKSAYQRARTTTERREASDQIDAFLRKIGIKLPSGRRPIGMPPELLEAVIAEATTMIEIVVEAPMDGMSPRAARILAANGIAEVEHLEYAYRLALPMLSSREISAIRRIQPDELRKRPATARKLAALLVAHRLRVESRTVLRKAFGSAQTAEYSSEPNPFSTT